MLFTRTSIAGGERRRPAKPVRHELSGHMFVFGWQALVMYLGRLLISQRSLHNAPTFRLLLKVAMEGTHECEFLNF